MRFLYRYQESAGAIREGEVSAASEAEAYSALRKGGIRPMRVWAKPGLVNRLSALGKRGLAIVVLAMLCIFLAVAVGRTSRTASQPVSGESTLAPLPRQQCRADAATFRFETERVMASFASPGDNAPFGGRDPSDATISSGVLVLVPDFDESLRTPICVEPDDSPEAVKVKRIVTGMKDEARQMVASGRTSVAVFEFFMARQRMEIAYRQKLVRDFIDATGEKVDTNRLESVNRTLRAAGLREIAEKECHPNG